MKLTLLLTIWFPFLLFGSSSSIDSIPLPKAPENRIGTQESESLQQDDLIWYTFYRFYTQENQEIKNGLWIERTRSRDRERFNSDFTEIRKIYYHGTPSSHSVESTWIAGTLRERVYILSEKLRISVQYNAEGQEVMGAKAKARGGRAKRERITRVFNDVYELND